MPLLALALLLSQVDPEGVSPEAPAAAPAPDKLTTQQLRDATRRLADAADRVFPNGRRYEPAAPPSPWHTQLSLGLTWLTGNAGSIAGVFSGSSTRKTTRTLLSLQAFASYGQTFADELLPSRVLLFNAGGSGQFDFRFNGIVSAYAGLGLDMDHVKSVELKGYGELGVGITWLDAMRGVPDRPYQWLLVKTDVGFRAAPERRYQYYPTPLDVADVLLLAPRAALVFHLGLSPTVSFHDELEFLANVYGPRRFVLNQTARLSVALISALSLSAAFTLRYDSAPAEGRRRLDTLLTLGLEAGF